MKAVCAWCRAEGRPGLVGERPPFDDLAEVRGVCWQHKLDLLERTRTNSTTGLGRHGDVRFLVIVGRQHSDLWPQVSERVLDDRRVRVLLDRRQRDRRQREQAHRGERRQAQRRRPPEYWEDIRYHAVVIVPVRRSTDVSPEQLTAPNAALTEATTMDDKATTMDDTRVHVRQQIDQWARTGQNILNTVIPALFQECESTRQRAASAEAQSARLSLEVEDLQSEITRLTAEIDRLKREAGTIADTVDKSLREIGRISSEVLLKLKDGVTNGSRGFRPRQD